MNFIEILNQSLQSDRNTYKHVVDLKNNNEIKFIKYRDVTNCDQSSCPISMNDFKPDEIIAQLPCKHCFEKSSILKWLSEESNKCPICRYELNYKEVRENGEEKVGENNLNEVGDDEDDEVTDDEMPELENVANVDEITDLFTNAVMTQAANYNQQFLNNLLNYIDNELIRRNAAISQGNGELENDSDLQAAILNSLMD